MAASKLNSNIKGYDVGEIPVKGAVTVQINIKGLGVPLQPFIDHQYLDSKIMSERPGMYVKYLPYRYDAVTGQILNGGSYLFDTFDNAKDYVRWASDEFQVGDPPVKFFEQPTFDSHEGQTWKVIGAHNFAPIQEHAIGRLQYWTYKGNAADTEAVLRKAYPDLKRKAEEQGAVSIWFLFNPEKNMVGIQQGFKKDGEAHKSAQKSVTMVERRQSLIDQEQDMSKQLGFELLFDRTSILLTLWLPRSRKAGGSELAIPYYPMVPDITHKHL